GSTVGDQARSCRSPSGSRTTTMTSAPVPDNPASRTATPAVVPAGTTTREVGAATVGGDWDTMTSSDGRMMFDITMLAVAAILERAPTPSLSGPIQIFLQVRHTGTRQ